MANKLTEKAGLSFNINKVKANMIHYFKVHDLNQPKFKGAHVAMTAALQELCTLVVKNALQHTHKDKSNVRTLTRETLRNSVLLHDGLKQYYYTKLWTFDKSQMYGDQLPVSKNDLATVVESVDGDLKLTPKALNFLNFLLLKAYLDVVSTSYLFIDFAKRKSLEARAIVYALKSLFADSVSYDIYTEVDRATTAVGDAVEKADGEDEDGDHADVEHDSDSDSDDGNDEEQPKSKGNAKGKGKAVEQVDSEDESSDESLEESSDDSSSSSEEVVASKPKGKPKAKANTKSKGAAKAKTPAKKQTNRRAKA